MERPTEVQIAGAMAVLVAYAKQTRGVAAENQSRSAVYSILSCLGGPGAPAQEYFDVVVKATDGEVTITDPVTKVDDGYLIGPNPYGIIPGHYVNAEIEDFDAPDDDEPDEVDDEDEDLLPEETDLRKMNKDALIEQARAEGVERGNEVLTTLTRGSGTIDEIVALILESRPSDDD